MNENVLFFFSGTGNSFDITLKIAERIGNTKIYNIALLEDIPSLENYKRIGLIFPVYGFTMPNIVSKFIQQLPHNINAYYFCIETFGGADFGAMYRTFEEYEKREIALKYITNIEMPENYILDLFNNHLNPPVIVYDATN